MFKAVDCTSDMDAEILEAMEGRMSRDSWDFYMVMDVNEAFQIAGSIQCEDNVWASNYLPAQICAAQLKLGEDIFEFMEAEDHVAVFARQGAYNRCRMFTEKRFPAIHASISDPWSFQTYSDLYKDRNGFRPRGRITGAEVREWLENLPPLDED